MLSPSEAARVDDRERGGSASRTGSRRVVSRRCGARRPPRSRPRLAAASRPAALASPRRSSPVVFAPAIAWWVSRPSSTANRSSRRQTFVFLRKMARKTWASSKTSSAPDHHLPPDNYQEQPARVVAHRTSPTNMGLACSRISRPTISATSGGGPFSSAPRTRSTTMASLERHQGHFYNWYDTQTLKPLAPLYVSSVDSGNLRVSLVLQVRPARLRGRARFFIPECSPASRDTLRLLLDDAAAFLSRSRSRRDEAHSAGALGERLRPRTRSAARAARACSQLDAEKCERASIGRRRCRRGAGRQPAAAARRAPRWIDLAVLSAVARGDPTLRDWQRWRMDAARALAEPPHACRQLRELARVRSSERRARAHRRHRTPGARRRKRWRTIEYDFLFDEERHLLAIGYNVERAAARRDLLRSARVRSAILGLRRHRAAEAPAGKLVRAGAAADEHRWRDRRSCRGAARCSST